MELMTKLALDGPERDRIRDLHRTVTIHGYNATIDEVEILVNEAYQLGLKQGSKKI